MRVLISAGEPDSRDRFTYVISIAHAASFRKPDLDPLQCALGPVRRGGWKYARQLRQPTKSQERESR